MTKFVFAALAASGAMALPVSAQAQAQDEPNSPEITAGFFASR